MPDTPTNWDDILGDPEIKFDLNTLTENEIALLFRTIPDAELASIHAKLKEASTNAQSRAAVTSTIITALKVVRTIIGVIA